IGNPLYHWSHLELRRYFGINAVICEDSCDEIWACANEALASPEMSVRGIIKRSGVEAICTTDDPCDTLEYHREIAADDSFGVRVLPAWRPDKGINLDRRGYTDYISRLDSASGVAICGIVSLRDAYMRRLNFFAQNGCVTADMGIDEVIPYAAPLSDTELDMIFKKAYESDGADITPAEANAFRADMFRFFAAQYKQRGWVMQIHYGVLRNVNPAMFKKLGADTGFDIIGGRTSTTELARLLGSVEESSGLPRTVIYSVNPEDNAATAALIGAFQRSDGSGMPLLMQGSAWWFNDNLSGMKAQMETLANMSAFGCFLGMLTDSRSFISYTRHEYFRRILCNMIGSWADAGLIPNDPAALADIVMDICYNNTKNFFGF
ncbi:MAG: glucuronate isomerase, partial [Eubacteriales bacterium]